MEKPGSSDALKRDLMTGLTSFIQKQFQGLFGKNQGAAPKVGRP
jgi:hypothetical protein